MNVDGQIDITGIGEAVVLADPASSRCGSTTVAACPSSSPAPAAPSSAAADFRHPEGESRVLARSTAKASLAAAASAQPRVTTQPSGTSR